MIDSQLTDEGGALTGRTLRQFGALCVGVFGALAAWNGMTGGAGAAVVFAALAVFPGAVGLAHPEAIRSVYLVLMAVTIPIGRVVSLLLLALIFYVVFTPLGLALRLLRRDALRLQRPDRQTHWVDRPQATDVRDYLRQS